ncbi:MAG: tyrosine-type recombinase/integrase [Candidatus Thiodiazotropha sp.]
MLQAFPTALNNVTSSAYEALLFSTAFSVAFFGFLRIGEMIADGKSCDTSRIIQLSDVSIYDENIKITLRFSKTDQCGKSAMLLFFPSQQKQICPVTLMKKFLQVRPKTQGPLFCHFGGQPITRYQFTTILNKVVKFTGSNLSSRIKGHSFRIGAATLASSQNVSDSDIKQMGRWSEQSASYSRYIRLDKIKT